MKSEIAVLCTAIFNVAQQFGTRNNNYENWS